MSGKILTESQAIKEVEWITGGNYFQLKLNKLLAKKKKTKADKRTIEFLFKKLEGK